MLSLILFAINTGNTVLIFSKTSINLTVIDKKKKETHFHINCSNFLLVDFSLCLFFPFYILVQMNIKKTQFVRILFMLILLNMTKNIFLSTNI